MHSLPDACRLLPSPKWLTGSVPSLQNGICSWECLLSFILVSPGPSQEKPLTPFCTPCCSIFFLGWDLTKVHFSDLLMSAFLIYLSSLKESIKFLFLLLNPQHQIWPSKYLMSIINSSARITFSWTPKNELFNWHRFLQGPDVCSYLLSSPCLALCWPRGSKFLGSS